MKDFFIFFDHLKFLFENELYEDAKLLADLLIGIMETKGMLCDPKDKYMVYYYYGISAFELRDFKLAESLFNKALQMNKSNLRPKPKAVSSFVSSAAVSAI
jgi:tetratricopeptide (TPR) repeat protein